MPGRRGLSGSSKKKVNENVTEQGQAFVPVCFNPILQEYEEQVHGQVQNTPPGGCEFQVFMLIWGQFTNLSFWRETCLTIRAVFNCMNTPG